MLDTMYVEWLKIAPFIYVILCAISVFTESPQGEQYDNFRRGKYIYGVLMLLMAIYISLLSWFDFRVNNLTLSKSINISSFFLAIEITEYMFRTLIGRGGDPKQEVKRIAVNWVLVSLFLAVSYVYVPQSMQENVILLFTFLLIISAVCATRRFFKLYNRVQNRADELYSDSIQPFLRYTKTCLVVILVSGFLGCVHSYFSASVNIFYGVLTSIAMTYTVIVFRNYTIRFGEMCYGISNISIADQIVPVPEDVDISSPLHRAVDNWVENRGFTQAGLTAENLARQLSTNRTYLTVYIRNHYKLSYREWITLLRMSYAKELLLNPDLSISRISDMVGYNRTSFTKIFTRECGIPPQKWRSKNLSLS